jgi:hypothetical protein
MLTEQILNSFGDNVTKKAKAILAKRDKLDTGKLSESLKFTVKKSKNSLEFTLLAEDYATFVDKGVKGTKDNSRAPGSPFQFKQGKVSVPIAPILGWVKRKRFQFRTKQGRFMSFKQMAFIIGRSIHSKGIKTSNFLTSPFNDEFKKLPKELIEAYGLDMRDLLKTSLKNNK